MAESVVHFLEKICGIKGVGRIQNGDLMRSVIRIKHIINACKDAVSFLEGKSEEEFRSDKCLIYAVVKALEIIGEAANSVSDDLQNKYPEIPWRNMINMRNYLVHKSSASIKKSYGRPSTSNFRNYYHY